MEENMGKQFARVFLVLVVSLPWINGVPGQAAPLPPGPAAKVTPPPQDDPEMLRLLEELGNLGNQVSQTNEPARIAALNLQEADVLYRIASRTKAVEQPAWVKQLADCLQVAAMNSPRADRTAYDRLSHLEQRVLQVAPGTDVAAYVVFRRLQLDHQVEMEAPGADYEKTETAWAQRLTQFIGAYPKTEEAASALLELAMSAEGMHHDAEARRWYEQLAEEFPNHEQAKKARGVVARIDLQDKAFPLSLPSLLDPNETFEIEQMRGRVVVVYFWASTSPHCNTEFVTLKQILERYRRQGLGMVCVNLDKTPEEALRVLSGAPPLGAQLYLHDGPEGLSASRYGLTSLPTVFVVGKDGKMIHRGTEVGQLETILPEQLK
jgi:thiol-disulfide isomerase/thioredoxin